MELLKLTKKDIFKRSSMNSTQNIDFYEPFREYEIYNENAYKNIRPVLKDFLSDYKVEQTKDDFNKKILDIQKQEEKEIAENQGEISIKRDPRITKYEDTYSITPYATYLLTPLSDIDGEDIVSRFDRCYGEWVNKRHEKCHENQPCKRIKQHFRIHNLDYTGDHCRDKEGRRLRDDDTRHVFCNHYQNHSERCSGKGKCTRNTIGTNGSNTCVCNGSYTGPNCSIVPLPGPGPPGPPGPPPGPPGPPGPPDPIGVCDCKEFWTNPNTHTITECYDGGDYTAQYRRLRSYCRRYNTENNCNTPNTACPQCAPNTCKFTPV